VKPNINSVEIHSQLSNNGHPVDGALVDAGSPCPQKGKGRKEGRKGGREGGHKLIIHPFGKGLCFQIMYRRIQNPEFTILKKIRKNSRFFILFFWVENQTMVTHSICLGGFL
jgi:hypothetical protein